MKYFTILTIILTFVLNAFSQRGVEIKIVDENGSSREVSLYEGSYALVIGASSYNNGWQKLGGVKNDVTAVSAILSRHGFTVEKAVDPTSDNLLSIIKGFVDKYGFIENNRLLIYFAGHGHTETGGDGRKFGYIVPVDAPNPDKNRIGFQQKAVTMDEIETVARRIRSKHALFVFDSCFSGSLVSRSKTIVPPIINYLAAQSVRQFITAGADNQEVPDESIFRQMFVRGLEGDADANRDTYITGTELAVYLQEQVIYYRGELQTPQYGKIRDPKLDRGDFIFTLNVRSEPDNQTAGNRTKAASLANQALAAMMRADFTEAESLAGQAIKLDDSSALGYGLRGWAIGVNRNDSNLARNDLEKAVRLDSNNPLFYVRLANIYRNLNDIESAKRNANEALQKLIKPINAIEYYAKGLGYDILGKNDEAIREYTNAIQLNSRFTIAYNNRGVIHDEKQEYNLAIQDYTKAIELNPTYAFTYNNRGVSYKNKQEHDLAIRDYTKAIELNPKYEWAYNNRGVSHNEKQEYDSAIRDYTKAIELNPNYAEAYYNRGTSYNNKKEYDFAIQDYTKAIKINPKDADAYFKRGFSYDGKKEYDLAIRDYTKVIELNPKYENAYYNRGLCYYVKKEFDLAIQDYTKVIEINPKDADAYFRRGLLYFSKKEYDLAIRDYNKAIEFNPKYENAYYNRGILYNDKKEYDLAIQDYTKVIELNPKAEKIYYNRGISYYDKKEYDLAIQDYTKAIELDPKDDWAYGNRGLSYQYKQEYDLAIRDYNKAIELNPKNERTYNNRGLSYRNKQAYDLAIRDYTKAIELNPKFEIAYKNRAFAYDIIGQKEKAEADRQKYRELGGQ